MNIVVPAAGLGSRMQMAGFKEIKPFIPVYGKAILWWALRNLIRNYGDDKFIFLFQKQHIKQYNILDKLKKITENLNIINHQIVEVDGLTEGTGCTCLLAKHLVNNDESLLVSNSDQFIDNFVIDDMIEFFECSDLDGGFLTYFRENDPKWSYVRVNEAGLVTEVAEKVPISSYCNTGHYWWRHGKDMIWSVEQEVKLNKRVNNEFYLATSYSELIDNNKKIGVYNLQSKQTFFGLGVPKDIEEFIKNY